MIKFNFSYKLDNTAFIIHVSDNIKTKAELLSDLSDKLHFPDYFGFNWDALEECLMDLGWIKEKKITVVHDSIPLLDEPNMKIYLSILNDAIIYFEKEEKHKLEIFFPKDCETRISLLLS